MFVSYCKFCLLFRKLDQEKSFMSHFFKNSTPIMSFLSLRGFNKRRLSEILC